jgi:hypothetical protein
VQVSSDPLQAPDHPEKTLLEEGVAVSTICVPGWTNSPQLPAVQLRSPSADRTVPLPVIVTVSWGIEAKLTTTVVD